MSRVECESLFAGAEVHPVSALHASAALGKDLQRSKSTGWVVRHRLDYPSVAFQAAEAQVDIPN